MVRLFAALCMLLRNACSAMPANYRRLAEAGLCDGDQLYRSLSSFKLVIEDAVGENFSKIEEECAKKCEGLAQKHSQCQGIEVRSDGACVLFDRDFTADDQPGLENTTGASLQKQINHKFPGRHLTSVNSDPYIWEHLSFTASCWRREPVTDTRLITR